MHTASPWPPPGVLGSVRTEFGDRVVRDTTETRSVALASISPDDERGAAPWSDDVTAVARTEYMRVEMIVKISTRGPKKRLDRCFRHAGCRTARRSCDGRPARLAARRNDGRS